MSLHDNVVSLFLCIAEVVLVLTLELLCIFFVFLCRINVILDRACALVHYLIDGLEKEYPEHDKENDNIQYRPEDTPKIEIKHISPSLLICRE